MRMRTFTPLTAFMDLLPDFALFEFRLLRFTRCYLLLYPDLNGAQAKSVRSVAQGLLVC